MDYRITADRLKLALKSHHMRPQELADQSGVSKSSISQYVNGLHAPSNKNSEKMAAALGVNPLWLRGFDVPMIKTDPVNGYFVEGITDDENQFIELYTRLDALDQSRILGYMEGLLGNDKYEK
ncbi:MAG: helix-turn-helix domain-containing protein [Clostridiales bacterium]|nr:helix-turn-helix domain-containing protein [Clostridiales bacterium]